MEATLEEMSIEPVNAVETLGVDAIQPLHSEGQVDGGAFDEQVVVRIEEAVAPDLPTRLLADAIEDREEEAPVSIHEEDRLVSISARGDVEEAVGQRGAVLSRHATEDRARAPTQDGQLRTRLEVAAISSHIRGLTPDMAASARSTTALDLSAP